MKMKDINKAFTVKVAEYIGKGYIINSNSMSGSQGEIGKIDLVKDNELVRIYLDNEYVDGSVWDRAIVLRVGTWKYPVDRSLNLTVWMKDFDIIEEFMFYEIEGNKWYTDDYEEFKEISKLRRSRISRRLDTSFRNSISYRMDEKAEDIAVKYLKRTQGIKRVRRDHLVVMKDVRRDGIIKYRVEYYGNSYKLS